MDVVGTARGAEVRREKVYLNELAVGTRKRIFLNLVVCDNARLSCM